MPTLHFKGKPFLKSYHHTVQFHRLVEKPEKSLSNSPSLDDNLIIHGDNLKALKALLPTHAGKVKCIYIDPPYNTGNEGWAYNDNVNSPMIQKWLGQVVAKDDLSRHDKWCCMMYPRLVLLRELLKDDGVIFVSIDDNEVQHLRMMMDEIFGKDHFVGEIIWQKKYAASNDAKGIAQMHDTILVFQKSAGFVRRLLPRTEKQDGLYKYNDKDGKGLWRSDNLLVKSFSASAVFPIHNPNTGVDHVPPEGKSWRAKKDTVKEWLKEGKIFFGKTGKGAPQLKRYLSEVQQGIVPPSWWTFEEAGHNDEAKKELEMIFEKKNPFDTPKPTRLIKRLIQIACDKGDLILDSFAGSGTMAHAVLDLNKEDGGNRKFIVVECEEYADRITAERVRRVIKGIPSAKDEKLRNGLGGSFSYYELGDPIDIDAMLEGTDLPTFADLAKYVFYTATGEQIDLGKLEPDNYYIGSSKTFEVFVVYEADKAKLKELALNSAFAEKIHERFPGKRKLVFAPACYLDDWLMSDLNISFAQLPFEIYRIAS